MCPQIACMRGNKVTMTAFVWFFSTVYFKIYPQVVNRILKLLACEEAESHCLHLFNFSPLCVFKCVLKLLAWEDTESHWLHLLDFSFQCIFKCIHKYSTQEEAKKHCTMKIMKVFVNLYFSDFEPIFWRFEVRYTKCLFYKKRLTDANTTNMFFGFFLSSYVQNFGTLW